MPTRTFFSKRIYKSDIGVESVEFIDKAIEDFASIRNFAFAETVRRQRHSEPKLCKDDSLYLTVTDRYPESSVYLRNAAINEAKAVHKSAVEINKLNVTLLNEKISKVKDRIYKMSLQQKEAQGIKDKLKAGETDVFKTFSRKYKVKPDGSVVVTNGKGKSKTTTVYNNLYDFECLYLRPLLKRYKSNLGMLEFKLNKLTDRRNRLSAKTYVPSVQFGTKKLRRQGKTKEYNHQRKHYFAVSGRNDSKVGNYVFNYDAGSYTLKITLNKKSITLNNVFFPYGQKEISDYYTWHKALIAQKYKGGPITFTVEDHYKYYIIKCMINEKPIITNYSIVSGVIGVDTNLGFWSVAETDGHGSLVDTTDIKYDWRGLSSNRIKNNIENAAVEVINIAVETNKPIVIEELKIKGSYKIADYNDNKSKNFARNMFAYNKMTQALYSRAAKCGVEVFTVSPSYTSLIAKEKYMPYYKRSIHQLAAYTIANRQLKSKERIPKRLKEQNLNSWKAVYNNSKKSKKKSKA